MTTITNLLYFGALVMFAGVLYIRTNRLEPAETVRARWPLRRFWVGEGLRYLALLFFVVTALMGLVASVAGGVWADQFPYRDLFRDIAVVLAAIGAAALSYSVALYWRKSVPKPDGF